MLDQYKNPGNPLAHYEGTAEEIIEQTGGQIDYVVLSAGTGGTITGTAKKLKEKVPGVTVVGVDPHGSILARPDTMNDVSERTGHQRLQGYHVEGIGYDFVPTVLDHNIVDHWVKTDDDESFVMARNIIRHEGLLCGGSCGSAMAGAYNFIRQHGVGKGKRVVVLLPDSARNYMSKYLDDGWMAETGFDVDECDRLVNEKGEYAKKFG